jgi:hypothetical protein
LGVTPNSRWASCCKSGFYLAVNVP